MISEYPTRPNGMVLRATLTLTALMALMATHVSAQSVEVVTLKTFDGNNSIMGELLDVDGETYRIMTIAGVIEVAVGTVDCSGAACPELSPRFVASEDVTLTFTDGSASVTGKVLSFNDAEVTIKSGLLGEVVLDRSLVVCSGPNCHWVDDAEPAQSAAAILQSLLGGPDNQ